MLDSCRTQHLQENDSRRSVQPLELWRPFCVMVMAGLLAAFLCEVILEAPIIPIYMITLGGSVTLALPVWRALSLTVLLRKRSIHG